jgi:hypothetical protein
MAFSSNFTKVKRGRDDAGQEAVFVEGTTADTEQALTAMYVNLVQPPEVRETRDGAITLPDFGALTQVPVENAHGAVDWRAILDDGPLPEVGEWVVAVGLAERGEQPSFLWAATLQVERFGR